MTTADRLAALRHRAGTGVWRPTLFDPADPAGRRDLDALLDGGAVVRVADTLADQLAEWVQATHPGRRWTPAELAAEVARTLDGRSAAEYGRWVFYPWSRTLCHVLPEADFRFLRAVRNRYKITPAEQDALAGKTVAVAGLSVGLAAAVTMALEGVGRRFRLADFDALGLSNLNRLRAGVPDLGTNKAVLAARQLYELDPYLDVAVFADGVREDNVGAFLGGADLLVEECDDLAMKVRLREEARRLRLPVLMDTSDRGLLDIERFDREPDRPLFHGLAGDVRAAELAGLSIKEKIPFVLRILDADRLSPAAAASLVEVGETVTGWPQLASAVALGGALVADAARRVLLGDLADSGRYSVDLDRLVRDGAGVAVRPPPPPDPPPVLVPPELPPRPRPAAGPVTPDQVRYVVGHGVLAPSGGNSQPWRFDWDGRRLRCSVDPARTTTLLDWDRGAGYLAVGAAVENIALAAQAIGLRAAVEPTPDPADPLAACDIRFDRVAAAELPLFPFVPLRVTGRRVGPRVPLAAGDRAALGAAAGPDARLDLLETPAELDRVAEVLAETDRFQFLHPRRHAELMGELRWTRAEADRTRDGLELATLELSPADRAALGVLASRPAMDVLRRAGLGRGLGAFARRAVGGASAVGRVVVGGAGPGAYFRGGRAVQRVWLTAAGRGLGLQPHSALPYLLVRLRGGDLPEADHGGLVRLHDLYRGLCPLGPGEAEVFLFRLFPACPPTARSLRRPLDDVLSLSG